VITFGPALPIGVWLIYDFDWRLRRLYYNGWSIMNGWVVRARPYIHMNNVYVNNAYRNVAVNRSVLTRQVNRNNLASYNSVHQGASDNGSRTDAGPQRTVNNKIIQRNMNVNDTRMDAFRGHATEAPAPVQQAQAPARGSAPPGNTAFGENRGSFGAPAASQRGQSSRASRPAPAPRPSGGGAHAGGGGGGGSHGGGGGGGGHHK
jgi:hypothetical protein